VVQGIGGRLQGVRDLRRLLVLVAVERHLRLDLVLLRFQPPPVVRAPIALVVQLLGISAFQTQIAIHTKVYFTYRR